MPLGFPQKAHLLQPPAPSPRAPPMTTLGFFYSLQIPHLHLPAWMLRVLCPLPMQYSSTQPQTLPLTIDAGWFATVQMWLAYTGLQIRSFTLGEAMLTDDTIKRQLLGTGAMTRSTKYLLCKHGELSPDPQHPQKARCHGSSFQSHHERLKMFHFPDFSLFFLL